MEDVINKKRMELKILEVTQECAFCSDLKDKTCKRYERYNNDIEKAGGWSAAKWADRCDYNTLLTKKCYDRLKSLQGGVALIEKIESKMLE